MFILNYIIPFVIGSIIGRYLFLKSQADRMQILLDEWPSFYMAKITYLNIRTALDTPRENIEEYISNMNHITDNSYDISIDIIEHMLPTSIVALKSIFKKQIEYKDFFKNSFKYKELVPSTIPRNIRLLTSNLTQATGLLYGYILSNVPGEVQKLEARLTKEFYEQQQI